MLFLPAMIALMGLSCSEPSGWKKLLSDADKLEVGREQEAVDRAYDLALRCAEQGGMEDTTVGIVLDHAALRDQQAGRYLAAVPLYERAVRVFSGKKRNDLVAEAVIGLSSVFLELREPSKAQIAVNRLLDQGKRYSAEVRAMLVFNVGAALVLEGSAGPGEKKLDEVLQLLEDSPAMSANGKQLAVRTLSDLASVYCKTDRIPMARTYSQRALSMLHEMDHPPADLQIKTIANAGAIAVFAGNWDESKKLYSEAVERSRERLSADHPLFGLVLLNYSAILNHFHRKGEAKLTREQADAIMRRNRSQNGMDQTIDISRYRRPANEN